MEWNFSTIAILIVLAAWVVQPLRIILSQRPFLTPGPWLNIIGSVCLLVGGVAFLGAGLAAGGGLKWLASDFEWPVGNARNVLVTSDGTHTVPHERTGRIPIYNRNLAFKRGWFIDSAGGAVKPVPVSDKEFLVYAARGSWKHHYDIDGSLISAEKYDKIDFSSIGMGHAVSIPTPFYLMVGAHPFFAWFVAAFGMQLLFVTGAFSLKKARGFTERFSGHSGPAGSGGG